MIQRSIFVLPAVLRLITVLFLLPFIGCLFEDMKNEDTCVENYCKIYFQQKCVQITSSGGTSRRKSPGNRKENGVGWVGIFFISECVSKRKTELTFCIQCILRCHSKSDLPVTPVTSSWDDCYDVFTAKRKFPVYLVLPLPVFDSNVYILRKGHNW